MECIVGSGINDPGQDIVASFPAKSRNTPQPSSFTFIFPSNTTKREP